MGWLLGRSHVSPATRAVLLATAAIAALTLAPAARAAEGFPDPTFGVGGFAIVDEPSDTNEFLEDVVVLPDGRILAGGSTGGANGYLLLRLNANGSPDAGFGPGGINLVPDTNTEGSPREINEMRLRADGSLVVTGLSRGPGGVNAFGFGRYLPGGGLDSGFGTGGLTTVPMNEFGQAIALDLAPDGKVVATGAKGPVSTVPVVRLTEAGMPDTSFNAAPAGVREVDVPGSGEEGFAVKVLGGGEILIGGFGGKGAFLAKLDADGNPVLGFGAEGIAVHDLGEEAEPSGDIFDLAVLPDGRILAAGDAVAGPDDLEAVVARLTPSGDLDPTFGSGGIFRANPTTFDDEVEALEVLPDGRILVAGTRGETNGAESGDTWLMRLSPDGHLDPSFGSGGESIASAVPGADAAFGLALQSDGKAVVAGDALVGTSFQMLVGRFTGPEPIRASVVPAKARCGGKNATIIGTARADKLKGTKKRDVIAALGGNDSIKALAGNDVVCGGGGKDTLKGGAGKDKLLGEGGKDRLFGEGGKDRLQGGGARDLCNGGGGKDAKAAGCETRKKLP